jgi:hypothetical protein
MMLPILISVSLAPGSYFFSAFAALTESTAAHAAKAIRHFLNIVLSPLMVVFIQLFEGSLASSEQAGKPLACSTFAARQTQRRPILSIV